MCRLAEQVPKKLDVRPRNWRCYIRCSISEADWEDFHSWRASEQRVAERQDGSAIRRCTLWENDYGLVRMLTDQSPQVCKFCLWRRVMLRILKSAEY